MTDVFIGIDVGTQGTKGIAYAEDVGRILASASASYSLLPTDVAGRAEQDPNDWIDAVRFVLKKLVRDLGLVVEASSATKRRHKQYVLAGIGISGQQHGMVLLDEKCKPLRPAKLWCDVEASDEARWIRENACPSSLKKWDHIVPAFTSPKVLWTIKQQPDIWKQVRWCVLPHDYVNLVLRGAHDDLDEAIKPTTDRGDASGSGIFDPINNQYCMESAKAIDPSGRYAKSLPTILDPLEICGTLSLQWMKDIGLLRDTERDTKPQIEIPISVGSGDNMCSALGVGCAQPGTVVLSLGTSGTIFGVSQSPPSSEVSPFADATGCYLPLACVMSCTAVLNSVLDTFFNGNKKNGSGDVIPHKWTHDDATEMARQHPPGCYGITFLPYLTPGERTPDWPHASGAILGLSSSNMAMAASKPSMRSTSPTNPIAGLIYRAAMEGITYLLAEALSTMKQACGDGFQPTSLLVVGGGSRNRLWRQMLADVMGMELKFPTNPDSAALGACFQAGAAVAASRDCGETKITMEQYILRQPIAMEDGIIRPTLDEQTVQLYEKGREQYRVFSRKLYGGGKDTLS